MKDILAIVILILAIAMLTIVIINFAGLAVFCIAIIATLFGLAVVWAIERLFPGDMG